MAISTAPSRGGLARAGAFRLGGSISTGASGGALYGTTFTIEMAFGVSPLTRASTWVDVSDHVRGFNIRRGRTHELSRTQTGELTLRLANQDRRFDPSNTASAYYPNVRPMAQVRVTGTYAGVDYLEFWGFVEDWGQTWPVRPIGSGGDAEVQVRAVDGFKLLGLYDLAPYSSFILSDNPVSYLRMQETSLPLTDEGSAGSALVKSGANVYPGQGTAPLSGGAASMKFDGTGYLTDSAPSADLILTNDVSVECWLKVSPLAPPFGTFSFVNHNSSTVTDWSLLYLGSPASGVTAGLAFGAASGSQNYAGDGFVVAPFTSTSFGTWKHVVGVRSNRDLSIYINGALVSTTRFQGTILPPAGTVNYSIGANPYGGTDLIGEIAHVAVYPRALSAERIAAHYAAKFDTFAEQSSGSHINAILDAIGWPTGAAREIDPGASTIGAVTPQGNALDWLLQIAEDSELGLFAFDNQGVMQFHDRHRLQLDHVTSEGTFGDDPADQMSYTDLQIRNDDADLWTTVKVTREGGSTSVATDAGAATTYGPRTLDRSGLLVSTDAETLDQANFLLARYKAPYPRVETLTVIPANDTSRNTTCLGLDCHHDRITIKRRPPGGGPVFSVDAHVEGLQIDYTPPYDLVFTYSLVPADTGLPIIFDDPVTGFFDGPGVFGY
jgi:hypothetical protein